VTASEFAFLALGLVLGVATGAALVEVARSRPPARREVRITVAPNSIPRRSATLADASVSDVPAGPARGGPADRRWVDRDPPPAGDPPSVDRQQPPADAHGPSDDATSLATPIGLEIRTPVPAGVAGAPFRLAGAGADATLGGVTGPIVGFGSDRPAIGIAITNEPDPMMEALRSPAVMTAVAASTPVPIATLGGWDPTPDRTGPAGTGRADAAASDAGVTAGPGQADGGGAGRDGGADGPCAEARRVADERCAVATRAREGANTAVEALRAGQRAYDEHAARAAQEAAFADPRAVRSAKEAAQHAFQEARAAARTREAVEGAARDWLTNINRINQSTREAALQAERHRAAATAQAPLLERLSVEADAARISAESAEEACTAAREAVAACQEAAAMAAAGDRVAAATQIPPATEPYRAAQADLEPAPVLMASRAGEDAAIIRMLRGDRETLARIVARLAGDDREAQQRWRASLSNLLEALVARTIEASAFDFPTSHPFWGNFTRAQSRDIAAALSSLGYRHDGFGGWADDRMPSQRDLSLAVGYAGLDPMRIREWPTEAKMRKLLTGVTVAADEYVWETAGGLSLGELVSVLGRRADGLTELWNDWGTVRPLLLSAD
jgi:hypothetical protein